jgi:HSP20 family protein
MNNRNTLTFWKNDWSPFADFHRDFGSLFDEQSRALLTPACDVEEREAHFLLSLEVPGMNKDDFNIEVENDRIVISGERRASEDRKENGVLISERRFGKFRRAFSVPAGFDADKVQANYKDGVLLVTLPKAEVPARRQIKVVS